MSKRKVEWDEWYPVYTIDDKYGHVEVELTDEEYADYERVMREFDAWQDRLSAARHSSHN